MRRVIVVAVVAAFAFVVACLRSVSYQCSDNTFCQHAGMQGTCEADKFCSYPDTACASGKRYGTDGPNAGDCVGSGSGSGSGGSFSIGGSAAGLHGSGFVLSDNGSDMLAIAANGPFTFAQKVANGGDYLVAVVASPAREQCVVKNGSGTVAGANVTNVAATCSTGSAGIACASAVCSSSMVCCHGKADATGTCAGNAGACSGNQQAQECDDAADCGGSPMVCCAHMTSGGSLKAAVQCVGSAANCTATGTDIAALLCDPNAATPCPGGMACAYEALHDWYRCQ